jgi:alkylation response protein AidB-like acyl-CoA dehydrogenase
MRAKLTAEQQQVQKTATEFLESEGGITFARRVMEGDDGAVDELWRAVANQGYPAVTVPAEYGGLGNGMVYLTALLEATGRFAMPGPLPETTALVAPLIAEVGTETQKQRHLEAIATGERRTSFALYDSAEEPIPDAIQPNASVRDDGSLVLSGTKQLVPYAGDVDRILVAARTRAGTGYDGITTCLVDPTDGEIDIEETRSLDRTRPLSTLHFDDVVVEEADILGPVHGGGSALSRGIDRYVVAITAMLVGGADRVVDLSVEHGNSREQYGQPVGRFQAVKHRTADMWMDVEHARSLTYYAAWAIDADKGNAAQAVSACKSYTADRLHRVFEDGMKNHGGEGFTWGHDGHIYLKQAKAWRNYLGSPEKHRDRLLETELQL